MINNIYESASKLINKFLDDLLMSRLVYAQPENLKSIKLIRKIEEESKGFNCHEQKWQLEFEIYDFGETDPISIPHHIRKESGGVIYFFDFDVKIPRR